MIVVKLVGNLPYNEYLPFTQQVSYCIFIVLPAIQFIDVLSMPLKVQVEVFKSELMLIVETLTPFLKTLNLASINTELGKGVTTENAASKFKKNS